MAHERGEGMKTVSAKCSSCSGTGLYSGMCEGPGKAVVCLDCAGTGRELIEYEPFVARQPRKDIKTVLIGRQSKFILETSRGLKEIPYKQWFEETK